MATQTTTTPFCFRCQHQPSPGDPPLKRCARCRSRHYCDSACQQNDWPTHKQECSILAAGEEAPRRQRQSMRINMGRYRARNEDGIPVTEPADIYYIRTSKPHLNAVSILGPLYPMGQVLEELIYLLRDERSVEGEKRWTKSCTLGRLPSTHWSTSTRCCQTATS